MAGPRPQDVDRHVGAEIRRRREELGMTQMQLGELVGVSYQQVHKYERGINRVAGSRLYVFAQALSCEVGHLFPPLKEDWGKTATANLMEEVAGLSPEAQRAVCALTRCYAKQDGDTP